MYSLYLNEVYDAIGRPVPHDGIYRTVNNLEDAFSIMRSLGCHAVRVLNVHGETVRFFEFWAA